MNCVQILLISTGLLVATGGTALAQIPAPMGPAPGRTALGTLDTDRDGSISRTEATMNPSLSAQFPMLDKNSNGALEPAEFARFEAGSRMGRVPPPGSTLRPPTNPGNPPASLQLDPNTPPEMNSTPPQADSAPPPVESAPPPTSAAPAPAPAPKKTKSTTQPTPPKQGSTYSPRSATSAGGPGDED